MDDLYVLYVLLSSTLFLWLTEHIHSQQKYFQCFHLTMTLHHFVINSETFFLISNFYLKMHKKPKWTHHFGKNCNKLLIVINHST